MSQYFSGRKWLEIAGIASLGALTHSLLIPIGLGLLDADDATVAFTTHLFREGKISPFYPQQLYGGVVLTLFRALWVSLIEGVFSTTPDIHVFSQFTFTYVVVPILLALASYALALSFLQKRTAAVLVGLVAAVGLQYWIDETLERDFYTAYVLLGMILLALRFRVRDPWRDLNRFQWFAVAALSGFALYTCRASAIYVVAYYWPVDWKKTLHFDLLKNRLGILFLGLLVGSSPEWLYLMINRVQSPLLVYRYSGFQAIGEAIRHFPQNLVSIVGPSLSWKAIPSVLLAIASCVVLFRSKKSFAKITRLAIGLSLASYLVINQTAPGVARYLLPLTPLWMIALGALFEQATTKAYWKWPVAVLVCAHLFFQMEQRFQIAGDPVLRESIQRTHSIVHWFQQRHVDSVISDDYWHANQYTFVSNRQPYFISDGRELGLPEAFALYPRVRRVGLILTHLRPVKGQVTIKGRTWRIEADQLQVGPLTLLVGTN